MHRKKCRLYTLQIVGHVAVHYENPQFSLHSTEIIWYYNVHFVKYSKYIGFFTIKFQYPTEQFISTVTRQ